MNFSRIFASLLLLLWLPAETASAQDNGDPVLHSTAEIRSLSRAQLALRPEVDFDAVILFVLLGAPPNLQVTQDGTAIYIHAALGVGEPYDKNWLKFKAGDHVRIRGHAKAGNFAPVVLPETIEKLGTGPMPEPQPITVSDLQSGRLDGQWVSIAGVVRDAVRRGGVWALEMGNAQGEFLGKMFQAPPPSLIGSRVVLRGVCLPYFNLRGQMMGLMIHIGEMRNVTVLAPAATNPFTVPEISAEAMRPFDLEQGLEAGRCRMRGTVIYSKPGSFLYLQSEKRGVKIQLSPNQSAAVGDVVDVSGFVRMRQGFAEMAHCLVRKVGTADLPQPQLIDSSSILSRDFYKSVPPPPDMNGCLALLRGSLLKVDRDPQGQETFWIEASGNPPLNMPVSVPAGTPAPRAGSLVELRGVCELTMPEPKPMDGLSIPLGLRLIVASGADLKVLRAAPWWTPQRLWMLVGGIALAFLLTLLQVRNLRHRVRVGAATLAEALVSRHAAEARIQERQRLSEEVHDIMAQSLTGVSLQLSAADIARTAAPEAVQRHLKLAAGLLELARDEIRRTLRDLRSSLLENGDLTGALQRLAEMFTKSGACEVDWDIRGTPPHVHPLTAHSLLRVTQESLTNSLKHGQATRIAISVDYSDSAVALFIQDNGKGTNPSSRLGPEDGHFGLENMRGRMRRLGGDFKFTSEAGKGATVEAHIPITPALPGQE